MGIDVRSRWVIKGILKEGNGGGFDTEAGHEGYLREAYHGGPYATRMLVEEAFDPERFDLTEYIFCDGEVTTFDKLPKEKQDDWHAWETLGVKIDSKTLRERLAPTVALAIYRHEKLYEGGKAPHIGTDLRDVSAKLHEMVTTQGNDNSHRFIACDLSPETLGDIELKIKDRDLPGYALAFVDFVELAERIEKETGEPIYISSSW